MIDQVMSIALDDSGYESLHVFNHPARTVTPMMLVLKDGGGMTILEVLVPSP